MVEKERIIKLIKDADISDNGWVDSILETINDKYAKGYLSACVSELFNSLSSSDEEFREELIEIADYSIWGK